MTEHVLYGGKGGVGKTTMAAATGLASAKRGERTLVVSTDPAHSLSDSFELALDGEPSAVRENLFAVEIDPESRADRYQSIVSAIASDLRAVGISLSEDEVERLFGSGIPAGGDEAAALDVLAEYVDSGDWGRIVFDTAPTGHTLRLLELPDVLDAALETTDSVRGQLHRMATSTRSMLMGPAAYFGREGGEDELAELKARMERAREVLRDPERTAFRAVLIPERMAIAETERLVERLHEVEMPVETLVVNKVLEDVDEGCSRCRTRRDQHRKRLAEIHETFPAFEIVTVPDETGEVHGVESLERIAERLEL
ncbi:ArsA family ATPase [Halalkalicoccus jeotgali]|uniref:Arsenite-activated ATPase ArsA n=1 Tax=Halalkalicoccus jeotgali (strain DSM 18796 / CECT 7217 / JCM 14584 / KCTC 4019 / B3) TaxID=795797 RepID=D8J8K0_HALJB|nr:TRC40/GET3/ArsA family transport-energizing ATPase [Halalkalicoccus jeotgali]ADJ16246.1 arsenite-activated ATPase ArsA [Halalkalicoccus jeotgali B3]ELY36981.1 arsenite-activated ATPase ArsA [Halalkalicoccus jeotgali B3]